MPTVNVEASVLRGVLEFISFMVLAIFAENVVLARALGVTRLLKLVPDHKAQIGDFCFPLVLVMGFSCPPRWAGRPTTCFSPGCARICPPGCRSARCVRSST